MIAGLSSGEPVVHPEDGVRCYAHILPAQSACLKITSTTSYLAANRDVSTPHTPAKRIVIMSKHVSRLEVGTLCLMCLVWWQIMVSVPSELSAWGPLEGLRRKESVMVGEGAEMGDKVRAVQTSIYTESRLPCSVHMRRTELVSDWPCDGWSR